MQYSVLPRFFLQWSQNLGKVFFLQWLQNLGKVFFLQSRMISEEPIITKVIYIIWVMVCFAFVYSEINKVIKVVSDGSGFAK